MLRVLWYFVKVVVAIAIAVWLAQHPGRVVIDLYWWELRIETSVGVLAVATLLMLAAAALVYRSWRSLRRAPGELRAGRRGRRRAAGYQALTQGMVAVAAGDPHEARRQARKAGGLLGEPPLTLLLSAQAAQLTGEARAAQSYFEAMLERPETEFLGLRGLIVQAMRGGAIAPALALARRARELRPQSAWVHDVLFRLLSRAGDWRQAQVALEASAARDGVARREADRRRALLLVERSRASEAAEHENEALQQARKAYELYPALAPAAVQTARLLARAGKARRALKTVEGAWQTCPQPDLAAVYAELVAGDALARVKALEKLYKTNPGHLESHIALAEAALDAKLWGEARNHLQSAAHIRASGRVCRLMARLEESENGDAAAARAWLDRAGEPDEAWRCADCGALAARWGAVCGHCGAFGSLAWGPPADASPRPTPALAAPAEA